MKKILGVCFLCIFTFWSDLANSTTVSFFTDQELTNRADLIFTGKCISKQSFWNDNHTRIYTLYKFQIASKIKCNLHVQTISFKQWGGQVGKFRYHIAGIATYDPNEDAFSFLTAQGKNNFRFTVGLAQGKLRILKNKQTNKRFLLRNTMGLHFRNVQKKGRVEVIPDCDGFERKIRGFISQAKQKIKHKK